MHYPSSAKNEFYRDAAIEIAPADMAIRLLMATGVKLKSSAQPAAALFQETL